MRLISLLKSSSLIIAAVFVLGLMSFASSPASAGPDNVTLLKNKALEFTNSRSAALGWSLNSADVQVVSIETRGSEAKAVMNINMVYHLKYQQPDEHPVIKAELAYLADHKNTLTDSQRSQIEKEVAYLRHAYQAEISNRSEAHDTILVSARLDAHGTVDTKSLHVSVQNALNVGYDQDGDQLVQQLQQKVAATQADVYAAMPWRLDTKAMLGTQPNGPIRSAATTSLYTGSDAVTYADRYVSPTTVSTTCYDNQTLQDTSWYNPNFQMIACNDCANFVSQALNSGWIPQTVDWNGSSTGSTQTWTYVPSLRDWMMTNNHWTLTDQAHAVPGDVIVWMNTHVSGTYHHVTIVTNNGATTFTGHTNDRHEWPWGGSSSTNGYPDTILYYHVS